MISTTGLHAINALVELAVLPEGEFAGAVALARSIDAPRNYLGKLLQSMTRAGLVQSRKGSGGGFRLARAPEKICLLDVIDPIDGVSRWKGCLLGGAYCSDDAPCAVHDRWGKLRDSYLALLTDTTIATLVERRASTGGIDANAATGRDRSRSGQGEELHGQ